MSKHRSKAALRLVLIVIIVLGLLIGISYMPLSKWSDGKLSDFNLLSDVLNIELFEEQGLSVSNIDSCLLEAIEEEDNRAIDTTAIAIDSLPLIAIQPSMLGDTVIIEDYTSSGHGLENLRNAIEGKRLARIAVIGDSYIEGDIFTEDLREMLQKHYGGTGVGYVNLYSEFPGFRKSVKQSGGKAWKEYAANKKHDSKYMGLTQHYFKLSGQTSSTYAGSSSFAGVDAWNRSQFLFISPVDTKVTIKVDNDTLIVPVVASDSVQAITYNGRTTKFDVTASNPSMIGFGVWLTDTIGVNVDCMSSRGFSGVTLANVSETLSNQLSQHVNYDLIILEFGINAMSPNQTKFTTYSNKMVEVITHISKCYPDADILLMGIGDRGSKRGTEVHSMSSCKYMVEAQREAARKARCLFWDTRLAMGGEDAIVNWVRQGWANKDYIHLNHNGSPHLAEPLFNAIQINLNR